MGEKRNVRLRIPKTLQALYMDLSKSEKKFFEDVDMSKEFIACERETEEVVIDVPVEVTKMEVRISTYLSAINQVKADGDLWPKGDAIDLKLYMQNMDIDLVDKGEFQSRDFANLRQTYYWKTWALAVYEYADGSYKAILWWKPRRH